MSKFDDDMDKAMRADSAEMKHPKTWRNGYFIEISEAEERGTLLWRIAERIIREPSACVTDARRFYNLTDAEVVAVLAMSD